MKCPSTKKTGEGKERVPNPPVPFFLVQCSIHFLWESSGAHLVRYNYPVFLLFVPYLTEDSRSLKVRYGGSDSDVCNILLSGKPTDYK